MIVEIVHYLTPAGADPFQSWLDELEDAKVRVRCYVGLIGLLRAISAITSFCLMAFGKCGWTSGPGIECISAETAPPSYCYFVAELSEHSVPT
jgi:hypothetical protein